MSKRELTLEVMRYDPEQDTEPYFQSYSVPCEQDWAILDALNYVKEEIDTTLSYRWSCHMMVCGSCGMMVNGEPSLTCKTFVRDLPDHVRIEPLANMPIERDLVRTRIFYLPRPLPGEITGGEWHRYGGDPVTMELDFYDDLEPSVTARLPEAYLVPPEWYEAVERLEREPSAFVLAAVGSVGARPRIRAFMERLGRDEGEDYLFVA